MNNLLSLIKIQFLSLFGINKIANKKKGKSASTIGTLGVGLVFVAIIVAIAYIYAKMFAEMYVMMGKPQQFLPTIFAMISVICLVFSFYSSSGSIYSAKDYDLLSAMPIKKHTIVLSKLIFMYIADLIFAILVLAVAVFVHFEIMGKVASLNLLRLFLMALALPFYPMLVSVFLGVIVSYISSKFRRKSLVQSLIYAFLFIGIYVVSLIGTDLEDSLGAIRNMYFIYPWVEKGMTSFSYAFIFVGVGIAILSLLIAFVSYTYDKLNTLLKSVKRAKNYRFKKVKSGTQFKALMKKEFRQLFSTPIYAMNTLLGSVFAVAGAIILTIMAFDTNVLPMKLMFAMILQPIFAFTFMISPTTAVSLNVEGSCFYLMRTSPISSKRIFGTKLFVNFVVAVIPALVCGIIFSTSLLSSAPALVIIFTILNAPLYAILGGNLGLMFNLLFPYMKWDNITKAVKQGVSVFFTVLCGMVIAGAVFAFLYFVNLDLEIKLIIVFAFLSILSNITYMIISKYGERLIIKKT